MSGRDEDVQPREFNLFREIRSLVTSPNKYELKTETNPLQKQSFEAKELKKDLKDELGLDLYRNVRISRKEKRIRNENNSIS